MTWSKRDEDWKNANSLFLCRLHCRRRPRILKSLYFATADWVQFCWLRVQKFTDLTPVGRIDESTARRLSLPIHEQEGGDRWHFRLRRCWKRVVSGRKPDDGVIFLRAGSRVKGVDINQHAGPLSSPDNVLIHRARWIWMKIESTRTKTNRKKSHHKVILQLTHAFNALKYTTG